MRFAEVGLLAVITAILAGIAVWRAAAEPALLDYALVAICLIGVGVIGCILAWRWRPV